MIKNSSQQTGSAHVVIIVVVVIIILGALGFVFWKNFMQTPAVEEKTQTSQTDSSDKVAQFCVSKDALVGQDGKFCSESVGIKFTVPEVFASKFKKGENYEVTQGPMENIEGIPAGKSLEYYEAVVTSGQETLSMSVAKEPSRSGYSSLGHALQRTYFNANTGNLHLVNSPTQHYDSATNTFKTTGSTSEGEPVPSFDASGTKVYKGQIGDADVAETGYLLVVNGSIVVIKIRHQLNPAEASTINFEKSFSELDASLKTLQVIK